MKRNPCNRIFFRIQPKIMFYTKYIPSPPLEREFLSWIMHFSKPKIIAFKNTPKIRNVFSCRLSVFLYHEIDFKDFPTGCVATANLGGPMVKVAHDRCLPLCWTSLPFHAWVSIHVMYDRMLTRGMLRAHWLSERTYSLVTNFV